MMLLPMKSFAYPHFFRLERIEHGGLDKQRVDLVLSCA